MFGFARAVDYAAHYRNFHFFHADVTALPRWHRLTKIRLNLLRHFLEEGAGSTSATGARRHLRSKAADSHGLKNLLRYANFLGAIATRRWSKRNANGVANTFLQQHT